jgi:hypothetical protein
MSFRIHPPPPGPFLFVDRLVARVPPTRLFSCGPSLLAPAQPLAPTAPPPTRGVPYPTLRTAPPHPRRDRVKGGCLTGSSRRHSSRHGAVRRNAPPGQVHLLVSLPAWPRLGVAPLRATGMPCDELFPLLVLGLAVLALVHQFFHRGMSVSVSLCGGCFSLWAGI